jgi:hypothetical protein
MDDFPAAATVPGQAQSRISFNSLQAHAGDFAWWNDFQNLRAQFPHFSNWRIWVYIAWLGMPASQRQPATEEELAEKVLGCTPRSLRNWKKRDWGEDYPTLDEAVAWAQASPLLRARREIYDTLAAVAVLKDPRAHQDRKLALELLGDYVSRQKLEADVDMPHLSIVLTDLLDRVYGDSEENDGDATGDVSANKIE